MKYYKCYILDGEPFNSERALRLSMRNAGVKTAKILIEYRRKTTGQLEILKDKQVNIRLPKP